VQLSSEYLRAGYFDEERHVWPGLLTSNGRPDRNLDARIATDLDRALVALRFGSNDPIKAAQLRHFYNYAKQIEARLRGGQSLEELVARLLRMEGLAKYAVGRGVACEPLAGFVHANVLWAQQSGKAIEQGFIPHFEAVVAYTTYYWGESERRA